MREQAVRVRKPAVRERELRVLDNRLLEESSAFCNPSSVRWFR